MYSDKEILDDGLTAIKTATSNYNLFSNECAHDNVRNAALHILSQEHDIQNEVFKMMSQRGLYPTPSAESKKIEEAKQTFSSGV